MPAEETQEKQSAKKAPGKKQMMVLWTAVLTALGGTGIPKIVDMLESKPSTEQVQVMIAKQTEALTEELNNVIDVLKVLEGAMGKLEPERVSLHTSIARLEARSEMVQDVLQTCCTRSLGRVEDEPTVVPGVLHVAPLIEEVSDDDHEDMQPAMVMDSVPAAVMMMPRAKPKTKTPFKKLNKLTSFSQQEVLGE